MPHFDSSEWVSTATCRAVRPAKKKFGTEGINQRLPKSPGVGTVIFPDRVAMIEPMIGLRPIVQEGSSILQKVRFDISGIDISGMLLMRVAASTPEES